VLVLAEVSPVFESVPYMYQPVPLVVTVAVTPVVARILRADRLAVKGSDEALITNVKDAGTVAVTKTWSVLITSSAN